MVQELTNLNRLSYIIDLTGKMLRINKKKSYADTIWVSKAKFKSGKKLNQYVFSDKSS